jgi:FkbM family methyltransferase
MRRLLSTAVHRVLRPFGLDLVRAVAPRPPYSPRVEQYRLHYGPDDARLCEFAFWLANEDACQWYHEWFYRAKNPTWELDEFAGLIAPGDRVLELGCHHGFLSMMLAQCIGPRGFLLAVDALPENAMIAQAQVALNDLQGRVKVLNRAASDAPGQVRIALRTNSHVVTDNEQTASVVVPTVTGDTLDEEFGPFTVLKLDVEGFEAKVLMGCRKLMARQPKLILETHPTQMNEFGYQASLAQVFDLIGSDDYSGTMVLRPNFHEVLPFDASTVPLDRVANLHLSPKKKNTSKMSCEDPSLSGRHG